jgi:hypothetical protein
MSMYEYKKIVHIIMKTVGISPDQPPHPHPPPAPPGRYSQGTWGGEGGGGDALLEGWRNRGKMFALYSAI